MPLSPDNTQQWSAISAIQPFVPGIRLLLQRRTRSLDEFESLMIALVEHLTAEGPFRQATLGSVIRTFINNNVEPHVEPRRHTINVEEVKLCHCSLVYSKMKGLSEPLRRALCMFYLDGISEDECVRQAGLSAQEFLNHRRSLTSGLRLSKLDPLTDRLQTPYLHVEVSSPPSDGGAVVGSAVVGRPRQSVS